MRPAARSLARALNAAPPSQCSRVHDGGFLDGETNRRTLRDLAARQRPEPPPGADDHHLEGPAEVRSGLYASAEASVVVDTHILGTDDDRDVPFRSTALFLNQSAR